MPAHPVARRVQARPPFRPVMGIARQRGDPVAVEHEARGPFDPGSEVAQQRSGRQLKLATEIEHRFDEDGRLADLAVSFRVDDHRPNALFHQPAQEPCRADRYLCIGQFEQHVAPAFRFAQEGNRVAGQQVRQVFGQPHFTGAAKGQGQTERCSKHAQRVERSGDAPAIVVEAAGINMRGGDHMPDPFRHEQPQHHERFFRGGRPVVDARQAMRVNVDHGDASLSPATGVQAVVRAVP